MPRGGQRKGAGRPLTAGELRKMRGLRATDKEWEMLQRFERIIKYGDKDAAQKFLDAHE